MNIIGNKRSANYNQYQPFDREFEGYQFDQFPDRLRFLHRQLLSPKTDLQGQIFIYLQAGCEMFGLEHGVYIPPVNVSREYLHCDLLRGHEGLCAWPGPLEGLQEAVLSTGLTIFAPVDGRLAVNLTELNYNGSQVGAYIATPLFAEGEQAGMLLFFSASTVDKPFSAQDRETVVLMAEGVARMNKIAGIDGELNTGDFREFNTRFVTPGVKSFKEYSYQAQLPQAYGVAGKVVDILKARIGHLPLGIEHISKELGLSKRTLQRRLQQQTINFAQLRDQVRFHYSINYLIEQNHSIEHTSKILDFSDRTSFTNAFKRWTGLSPSTFRKLFRDYV